MAVSVDSPSGWKKPKANANANAIFDMKKKQPEVSVGIVDAQKIRFHLNGLYQAKGMTVDGEQIVEYEDGGIRWNDMLYQELAFSPCEDDASFALFEVTIGINFHWERKETQTFIGALRLIVHDGKLCAINVLPVEEYLVSVISSEMSATASLEFLKAHAVISRSWLMAQMEKRKHLEKEHNSDAFFSFKKSDNQLIRWYDREDHTLFDVCADDHCQRYQGITRASSPQVRQAIVETCGQVLKYEHQICDARFSKCCGGITEEFETCWEDVHKPYLIAKKDVAPKTEDVDNQAMPEMTEDEAQRWILLSPSAFCNTQNKRILSQILNHYDQETSDFYRWTVEYTQEQLADLISRKLKMSFGKILNLIPLHRGKSGRISLLRIEGSERSFTIGKELEIRRALSETHLFSSAFVVERQFDADSYEIDSNLEFPSRFILHGAGWGHGVGLCQIGAAVMGDQGYKYDQILHHYYPGTEIERMY